MPKRAPTISSIPARLNWNKQKPEAYASGLRVPKKPPTVKTKFLMVGGFLIITDTTNIGSCTILRGKNCLLRKMF